MFGFVFMAVDAFLHPLPYLLCPGPDAGQSCQQEQGGRNYSAYDPAHSDRNQPVPAAPAAVLEDQHRRRQNGNQPAKGQLCTKYGHSNQHRRRQQYCQNRWSQGSQETDDQRHTAGKQDAEQRQAEVLLFLG